MSLTPQQRDILELVQIKPEPKEPDPLPKPKTQTVVGGNLLRTPVNKLAAIVTSKAPWWAKPPANWTVMEPNGTTEKPKEEKRWTEKEIGSFYRNAAEQILPKALTESGQQFLQSLIEAEDPVKNVNDFYERLALTNLESRSRCVRGMAETFEVLVPEFERITTEFTAANESLTLFLNEFRLSKQSIVREVSDLVGALRDLRTFFHGSVHAEEMKRLKEFVELCERLKALKDSGFLDTVADTMLRIAK